VTRPGHRYPLPSAPDGWYRVGASSALPPGGVQPLRYFGRELVLFRGEDGTPRLFDAHCPHLGAHLGWGGRVRGAGIRCPFHGWCYDGDGRCIEVPRLRGPVPKVGVRSHPVREVHDMLFAWHHTAGEPPGWEVAPYREGGCEHWTPWTHEGFTVRTHVQDMGENILDQGHFLAVHDVDLPEGRAFEARFEGPYMIVEQALTMTTPASRGTEILARTVNSGPGVSVTSYAVGEVETITLVTQTPVEEDLVELGIAFSVRRLADQRATAEVERMNREIVVGQLRQDIPIWEHRIYRERPILTGADGPIREYRRWFRQFYSEWSNERTE